MFNIKKLNGFISLNNNNNNNNKKGKTRGVWDARAEVQVSRRKFHIHMHLDQAKVKFLSFVKKLKKKKISLFLLSNVLPFTLPSLSL